MRRIAFALAFGAIVGTAGAASADLLDYSTASTDWTGLSGILEIAETMGTPIEVATELDYSTLRTDRPLIIIYPKSEPSRDNLARFIVNGGRIMLADDFGESEALMDRLEIRRVVPELRNLPHETFADGNIALPVFTPTGKHPLLEGVQRVVANHPVVISNVGGPVVGYEAGGGLVYDMNLGDGKAIVVGDASMFINQMLPIADNERFFANALRYLCRDRSDCRPILVTRDFGQRGNYRDSPLDAFIDGLGSFDTLNEALAELVDSLPSGDFLYYLSLILGLGLAVYLGTVLPLAPTRPYSRYVADVLDAVPAPQSEFDWNVSRFGEASTTMNFALPMAVLKEVFEELFLDDLGFWPSRSDERPSIQRLGDLYAERYLGDESDSARKKAARSDVVDLLAVFAQVPPRSRVFLDGEVQFSASELLRHYRRAREVLERMGLLDEYERRTRGLP